MMVSADIVLQFWAKKKKDSEIRYLLLYHMMDVVAVAQELWDKSLHASARNFMSKQTGLSHAEARKWVSFWAGLHDIGKASPGFQCQDATARQELQKHGFATSGEDPGHGTITTCLLKDYLQNDLGPDFAQQIATTLGGHHGIFPRSQDVQDAQEKAGNPKWHEAQQALLEKMSQLCDIKLAHSPPNKPTPAFFMFLAGLTSVADWIASNEDCFPYKVEHHLEDHLAYAQKQARRALEKLGWTGWQPPSAPAQIRQLFPSIIKEIRPLQEEAVSLAHTLKNHAGLIIIEAPMGEGKTEAAIYLADSWAAGLGQKGCYFALPTMATSDQMFGRVRKFLENRYQDETINLMLLHGHAALSAEFESLRIKETPFYARDVHGDQGHDSAPAGVVASEWFTYRKRGLLTPFGVGTIDQTLLAVLQTRHVFVRLFGLASKTIIIDEIHAYDAYMTTLLERLLEWLAALGSSVVMLSATLPQGRRDALLRAYVKGLSVGEQDVPDAVAKTSYPRISWTVGGEFKAKSIATSPQSAKELHIQWVKGNLLENDSEFELGKRLEEALSDGGCAAVICNTVDQAQKVYLALKPYFSEGDAGDGYPELDLLHARFLYGERKKREERTLLRFRKEKAEVQCNDETKRVVKRPPRAVLVSTQIIEQSLDLDFDLMLTEMAPIDLLLQRAGRLHRHERQNRPSHLKPPALWICQPAMKDGVPDFGGGTEAVYDYHVLLRSWLAIKDREMVKIPEEVEELIEKVYDEKQACPGGLAEELKKKWEESKKKLKAKETLYTKLADGNSLLTPDFDADEILEDKNKRLEEEEDPSIHETLQALTRVAEEPSVSVICLWGTKENPRLGSQIIDIKSCPGTQTTRKLLEYSVRLSHKGLVPQIIKEKEQRQVPIAWRQTPPLRHHYLLYFKEDNICDATDWILKLDRKLGLTINRKEE